MAHFPDYSPITAIFHGWVSNFMQYETLANTVFAVRFPSHPFTRSLRRENPQIKIPDIEASIRAKSGMVAPGLFPYLFQKMSLKVRAYWRYWLRSILTALLFILFYASCLYLLNKYAPLGLPPKQAMRVSLVLAAFVYAGVRVHENFSIGKR